MNIQVTQENLSRALSNVSRVATSSRGALPILSNILIKTTDGRLTISATNLEIAITEVIGAKVMREGSITLPAKLIQEYVSSLPKGTVTMELEDHKLKLSCGDYTSTINGTLADDYPVIPQAGDKHIWKINSAVLKKALSQVVFAASSDDARPVLTGVLLHTVGEDVFFAATDSYRLSEKRVGTSKSEISLLIPGSSLNDLQRILSDDEADVFVYGEGDQVAFKVGDIELVSRLIEGTYPDYRKLLPAKFESSAELERSEYVSATKLASLFARESAGAITVSVKPDTKSLNIQSSASQLGENSTSLSASVEGDGVISLNSRFLLDGLQSLEGDTVQMSLNGKLDPCVLRAPEHDDYLHIIMPLKS
ncbi:MAG: DNA polymerase III subunit beta [Patescibacteria group bacterium]